MERDAAETAVDLSRLLVALQDEFEWENKAATYNLVDSWRRERSGSTFYRMEGSPGGPTVVLKTVEGWKPGDAEQMFLVMTELADTLQTSSIDGAQALRPLAWADHPPLVVTPFLDGSDVVSILRRPEHESWSGRLDLWMHQAGQMLATYHAHSGEHSSTDTIDEARLLGVRFKIDRHVLEQVLAAVDAEERSARSFGDIGPGNLHTSANGEIYLLDPPIDPSVALIHRDLGNFVFEMRRQLAGRGFTRTRPVEGEFDRLRSDFIGGYSERSHGGPIESTDDALIALFEMRRAAGMARKRLPGRPGDALWFARSALARRGEVVGATGR
jgi:hypothetical protein